MSRIFATLPGCLLFASFVIVITVVDAVQRGQVSLLGVIMCVAALIQVQLAFAYRRRP